MEHKLTITPLAGSSELGVNSVMCEYKQKIILINLGASVIDSELVIPNLEYLIANKAKIEGIFLTSAHTDNIGGIIFAIESLGFPDIFAHELVLDFLRKQLTERNLLSQTKLHPIKPGSILKSDDLHLEFFALSETQPHSLGIYLNSPSHKVVYVNRFNWNQDNTYPSDFHYLGKLSAQKIDLLIMGSANSRMDGYTPSLLQFTKQLRDLVMEASGKTIVSLSSTNLSYITAAINLAAQIGYKVCLLGRPMQTAVSIVQKHEQLDIPAGTIIHPKNINRINPKKLIVLSAGKRTNLIDDQIQLLTEGFQGFTLSAHDQILLVPNRTQPLHEFYKQMNIKQVRVNTITNLTNDTAGYPYLSEQLMMVSLLQPTAVMPLSGETGDILHTVEALINKGINARRVITPANGNVYGWTEEKVVRLNRIENTFTVISEHDNSLKISQFLSEKRALAQGVLIVGVRLHGKDAISLRDIHIESRAFLTPNNTTSLINRWRGEIVSIINDAISTNYELEQVELKIKNYFHEQVQNTVGKLPLIVINIFK